MEMERLALCCKVLYDRDILEKQKEITELKKQIKNLEKPKIRINNEEELEIFQEQKDQLYEKLKYYIFDCGYTESVDRNVNNMDVYQLYSKHYGLTKNQRSIVYYFLVKELTKISNNKNWAHTFVYENIDHGIRATFRTLRALRVTRELTIHGHATALYECIVDLVEFGLCSIEELLVFDEE